MNNIKVLIFPYGSSEPIRQGIDCNRSNIVQIIEGKFEDIPLPYSFVLLLGRNNQEDFKYQEEYGLYGNFIIAKHNYKKLISLTDSDVEFIENNIKFLIDGPYPKEIQPDIDLYLKSMYFIDAGTDW